MSEFWNSNLGNLFQMGKKLSCSENVTFIYFYLSDNSPSIGLHDRDLCPRANVEISSFLEIL